MVATNLKAETISMMDKRSSLETEMNAIIDHLCGPGGPGISGNLVDFEGFPRSDIDIPAVRAQRSRLAALRNDHKVLTAKIDENLQVLHSARLTKVAPLVPKNSDASASIHDATSQFSPMDEYPVTRVPFAMIDEITDDSPAAEDGLQLGDQIIKFGNVEMGDEVVRRLASEAQSNQGLLVPLVIMRQGSLMNLTITPRQWQGRGLLGSCFRMSIGDGHLVIQKSQGCLHYGQFGIGPEASLVCMLFSHYQKGKLYSGVMAATYLHLLPVMVRWDDSDHDTALVKEIRRHNTGICSIRFAACESKTAMKQQIAPAGN